MASCGIRVRELHHLRFQDIQLQEDDDGHKFTTVQIRAEVAKNREARTSICYDGKNTYDAIERYKMIRCAFLQEPHIEPHNLVFQSTHTDGKRETIDITSLYKWFQRRWLVHEDESKRLPKFDDNGRPYNLTSARHFHINEMISNGADVILIANNCGTSTQMIYANYSDNQSWRHRLALTSKNYRRRVFGEKPDK
jgi:integrase